MNELYPQTVIIYIWWLLINGFTFYSEFHFLSSLVISHQKGRYSFALYILLNCLLTFFAMYLSMPAVLRELLHIVLICVLPMVLCKLRFRQIIAPTVIIVTLYTFMEGISAVLMHMLVRTISGAVLGNFVQIVLSVLLALLFYAALRFIAGRHASMCQKTMTSYLYILLLPCVFITWIVKFGLGLNGAVLDMDSALLAKNSYLWALFGISGALMTFFVILKVLDKIISLSSQETEKALLDAKLREQHIYLAEAKKRDEKYRTFQHDIHNHLLILSGLLQEKKYSDAVQYFERLNITSSALLSQISTGNSVLDILLSEKIRYAEQNQITISQSVILPDKMKIEDVDLCILFSNALDNAIHSCLNERPENRIIKINTMIKHRFWMLEVTNPTSDLNKVIPGTGLKNIKNTSEKYQGTLEFGKEHGAFRLSVLLCWE